LPSPQQAASYKRYRQRELLRTAGWDEGVGLLNNCPMCDAPVLEAHVDGLVQRLDTRSVPLADAIVLRRYYELVYAVWRKLDPARIRYHVTLWALYPPRMPQTGSLHVWHLCHLKRRR